MTDRGRGGRGRGSCVRDAGRGELKIAEALLCLLLTTVKTLRRPLLETAESFQKQRPHQGAGPSPQWPWAQGGDGLGLVLVSWGNMTRGPARLLGPSLSRSFLCQPENPTCSCRATPQGRGWSPQRHAAPPWDLGSPPRRCPSAAGHPLEGRVLRSTPGCVVDQQPSRAA